MATTYHVTGMSCEGCVKAVTNAIRAAQPEAGVDIDLETGHVTVSGSPDAGAVADAVTAAGFTFGGPVD